MTWFRVDDGLHSHPKTMDACETSAGPVDVAPIGLWALAGSWAGYHLTDGFVPRAVVMRLDPDEWRANSDALVRAGFWRPTSREGKPGWIFHDWQDRNPTSDDVIEVRQRSADRQKAYRQRKQAEREAAREDSVTRDVTRDTPVTSRVSNASRYGPVTGARPDPTRPDPTRAPNGALTQEPPPTSSGPPRGSRVPDPFMITDELRSWARAEAPNAGPRDHDAFMDFWRGAPGAKGVKKDWPATWRNWMRKASDEKKTKPGRPGLVEVNGAQLTDRNAANLALAERYALQELQESPLELEAGS